MFTVCGTFTMQVDGNGVVTFDPDLNSGRPAYRIENRHRGKHSCTVKAVHRASIVAFIGRGGKFYHAVAN